MNECALKGDYFNRNYILPTIDMQGRTVSFQGRRILFLLSGAIQQGPMADVAAFSFGRSSMEQLLRHQGQHSTSQEGFWTMELLTVFMISQ